MWTREEIQAVAGELSALIDEVAAAWGLDVETQPELVAERLREVLGRGALPPIGVQIRSTD